MLSIPAGHDFVARLDVPQVTDVVRLTDPAVPGGEPGQWWPHAGLEPSWVEAHLADMDVAHLHFGFEHRSPEQLADWVSCLRRHRIPLVLTVHDLRNPHEVDPAPHLARLDVLVPAAAAVITLTQSAARAIAERWRATPTIIAHHSLIEAHVLSGLPPQARHEPVTVGVRLGPLRPSTLTVELLRPLAAVCAEEGAQLRVSVHEKAFNDLPAGHQLRAWHLDHPLERTSRVAQDELVRDVVATDLLVLPHAWGTHSGWVELALDVGTRVLVPRVGSLADQGDVASFTPVTDDGGADLRDVVRAELAARRRGAPAPRHDVLVRRAQRVDAARAHAAVYRRVLADV